MADRIKLGIIGGGAITQIAHLPTLRKLKDVDVLGICDADMPKARALAERFQIPDAFDDIEELLAHEELDALLICTPNHLHEAHILAALSRGLHVFVEKPLTMSAASAQKIAKAAEKKNQIVMVGMNHRYRPDVQLVRNFIQSGELGPITSARGSWHIFGPGRTMPSWRTRRDQAGGGAIMDLGVAILDLALWLSGSPAPVRVSASLERAKGERGVEPAGSAFVLCEGGASVFIDVTWHHFGEAERFGLGLRGTRGTAAINPLSVFKEFHGQPVNMAPQTGSMGRENASTVSYRAEWAHFVAAIRGEVKPPSLQEHVMLHRVVDAIYKSADDDKDIVL
jgi:predicted dehydrogenase